MSERTGHVAGTRRCTWCRNGSGVQANGRKCKVCGGTGRVVDVDHTTPSREEAVRGGVTPIPDGEVRPCFIGWMLKDDKVTIRFVDLDRATADRHMLAMKYEGEMFDDGRRYYLEESVINHLFGESISDFKGVAR